MSAKSILVVDDEIGIRELLRDILLDEGHHVSLAENAAKARELRQQQRPDLVLLDIWMPDCDGVTLLKEWSNAGLLSMPVIMMSGHGTIDTAVEATKIGAFDFLEKPIAFQKLLNSVAKALKHAESVPTKDINLSSLGKSPAIQEIKQRLERIALSKVPLLLISPKGGNAEQCARFLHQNGTPWLSLEEYEKLATAPSEILEQVQNGLLFIPEIATLTKTQQKGLSLTLAKATEKYNARVVVATCKVLPDLVEDGHFDSALFQSLNAVSIRLPSLHERREDIPDIVNAISNALTSNAPEQYKNFDIAALNALRNADWSGDLAQLQSVVKNLLLTSLNDTILLEDVQRVLSQFGTQTEDTSLPISHKKSGNINLNQPLREARDDFERTYFKHQIQQSAGNMNKLAEFSGLERTHLYRKLKQLGIKTK